MGNAIINALLIAGSYYVLQALDKLTGFQTIQRPLVMCTVTGLVCGDLTTGVIIGVELEAVYMGIAAIGGAVASNYQAASCLCVGFVVLNGADLGVGMALAITVGTLLNAVDSIANTIPILMHPISMKIAREGNFKKMRGFMWFETLIASGLIINAIVIFVIALGGEVAITTIINHLPAFILNGLTAAANMLVVVGLCLVMQAIWNGTSSIMFVLLGFVIAKYLGLPVIAIAIIGVVIAFVHFQNKYEQLKNNSGSAQIEGGDDFYG